MTVKKRKSYQKLPFYVRLSVPSVEMDGHIILMMMLRRRRRRMMVSMAMALEVIIIEAVPLILKMMTM